MISNFKGHLIRQTTRPTIHDISKQVLKPKGGAKSQMNRVWIVPSPPPPAFFDYF